MDSTIQVLIPTAALIGVLHTLAGPDHYLPFVAMARAGQWSLRKTLMVTALCGLGHVAGSILLGCLGVALGFTLEGINRWEHLRGALAGWMLLGLGIAYTAWGIRRGARSGVHEHVHVHADGTAHTHAHNHFGAHAHVHGHGHGAAGPVRILGGWGLFLVFVLGPCEPLVPLLMYPAASRHWFAAVGVVVCFATCTLVTMLTVVVIGYGGLSQARFRFLERHGHTAAGAAVACCGLAVVVGL